MHLSCENFKNEQKKLKKHYQEQIILEKLLLHIKICQTYDELVSNPISTMYGFEALKHELFGYYSFRLSKKGGVIRLIFTIDKEKNIVKLEFISMDHYEDFKKKINK